MTKTLWLKRQVTILKIVADLRPVRCDQINENLSDKPDHKRRASESCVLMISVTLVSVSQELNTFCDRHLIQNKRKVLIIKLTQILFTHNSAGERDLQTTQQ